METGTTVMTIFFFIMMYFAFYYKSLYEKYKRYYEEECQRQINNQRQSLEKAANSVNAIGSGLHNVVNKR